MELQQQAHAQPVRVEADNKNHLDDKKRIKDLEEQLREESNKVSVLEKEKTVNQKYSQNICLILFYKPHRLNGRVYYSKSQKSLIPF